MARKKTGYPKVKNSPKTRKFVLIKEAKRQKNPSIVETVSVGIAKRTKDKKS